MRNAPGLQRVWKDTRGSGKRVLARLARKVLPDAPIRLHHVEPTLQLRVSLRRNVMFWSSGLARYETRCVRALRAALSPGDVAFDVGANIGFFTTLLSRWLGSTGLVVAVEPDPENIRWLRRNLVENRCENVRVHECALGAAAGQQDFSRDLVTGATGCLARTLTAGEAAVGRGRVEILGVQVETLDTIVERVGAAPDVVKIDIEGGEAVALQGARRVLEDHRPVILSEISGAANQPAQEQLDKAGYKLWDVETGRAVEPGQRPFLVAALPAETLETPRARNVLKALGPEQSGDRSHE